MNMKIMMNKSKIKFVELIIYLLIKEKNFMI